MVNPPSNLDPNAAPWGRWVTTELESIQTLLTRSANDQINNNKQLNSSINLLTQQVNNLALAQQQLTEQQTQLTAAVQNIQDTTDYLAGLVTIGASGDSVANTPVPNDGTFRYYNTNASLNITSSTGKVLVGFGVGEAAIELSSGGAAIAEVGFSVNGGGAPANPTARLYVSQSGRLGAALTRFSVINVPVNTSINITNVVTNWATGGSGATAAYARPWLTAQVIA